MKPNVETIASLVFAALLLSPGATLLHAADPVVVAPKRPLPDPLQAAPLSPLLVKPEITNKPPKSVGVTPFEIVIKFRDSAFVEGKPNDKLLPAIANQIKKISELDGTPTLRPIIEPKNFSKLEQIARERGLGQGSQGTNVNVRNYFLLSGKVRGHEDTILAQLSSMTNVIERAYPAPLVGNPQASSRNVAEPSNPFWYDAQNHLLGAPTGIAARVLFRRLNAGDLTARGCDGAGLRVIDLEAGWATNHQAVRGHAPVILGRISDTDKAHGTSVLGIMCAKDDQPAGILGIAPHIASLKLISHGKKFTSVGDSIVTAALDLIGPMPGRTGDVLVVEVEMIDRRTGVKYPAETEEYVLGAIQRATQAGVVVIEAAGNGALNLDREVARLNRCGPFFLDSGAIIVAGGRPSRTDQTWERWSLSNYGSRMDCFARAQNITTADYPSTGSNPERAYTSGFSGTSAATAIVAGAVLATQGMHKARRGRPMDPFELRAFLRDVANGTPSTNRPPMGCDGSGAIGEWIGVMPDLVKISTNL